MYDKSYEMIKKYVHTERMFRDICLQKLKMLEFRQLAHNRVVQKAHDSVNAGTILQAKAM